MVGDGGCRDGDTGHGDEVVEPVGVVVPRARADKRVLLQRHQRGGSE